MSALSDYLENAVINKLLRNQAFTPPTTIYLALFTAVTGLEENNPTAECQVPGVGGYARQSCALDAATTGVTANTSDITFPISTVSWGTITHVALVDHATNVTWGTNVNVLVWAALDSSRAIAAGEIFKINAGDLDITVS